MCVHLPGRSHSTQVEASSVQLLSLSAQATGPAGIGSGSSHIHTRRKCARKRGTEKTDQMPCQAWVSHALTLAVSLSGWQEHGEGSW